MNNPLTITHVEGVRIVHGEIVHALIGFHHQHGFHHAQVAVKRADVVACF